MSDDLLSQHPAQAYADTVVFYGDSAPPLSFAMLARAFALAADRIAASIRPRPIDDLVAIPWLYLHRHAIELELKAAIIDAAYTRRLGGDADPNLTPKRLLKLLRHGRGHNLRSLLEDLDTHLTTLGTDQLPADVHEVIEGLAGLDPGGMSLRYPPDPGTVGPAGRVNFRTLNTSLVDAHGMLGAVLDVLDSHRAGIEMYREAAAEMAAEYEQLEAELAGEYMQTPF